MPLSEYNPARTEVFFPGGSFMVRGLAVSDLTVLTRLHLSDIESVREVILEKGANGLTPEVAMEMAIEVIQRAPLAAATAIALAADELDQAPKCLTMPLHIQFAALKAIGELTFEDVAGLKLMIATAVNAVRAALPRAEPSPPTLEGRPS